MRGDEPIRVIRPAEQTLGQLLSKHNYVVPIFQREYSWKAEHVNQFLEDLDEHMKDDSAHKYYFFGTCYITHDPEKNAYTIVDGQQRITTITIFLIAARDFLRKLKEDELANSIDDRIMSDDCRKTRLTLNKRNDKFFQHLVTNVTSYKNEMTSVDKRLKKAYDIITEYLEYEKNDGKQYPRKPDELRRYITKVCRHLMTYFVVLVNEVDSADIVQDIFESVNHRGMDLHESDHVKNQILMIADTKELDQDVINGKWIDMLDVLGKIKIGESFFLRHYLIAYHKQVKKSEVASTIKTIVRNEINPTEFVEKLYEAAVKYKKLIDLEEDNFSNEMVDVLKSLKALKSQAVYPALLIGYDVFKNNLNEYLKFANILTNFFFRARTIGRAEAKVIEERMSVVCNELRKELLQIDSQNDILETVKSKLRSAPYPADEVFKSKFSVYDAAGKAAKYILCKLNAHIEGTEELKWKYTKEHILPQKPDEAWEDYMTKRLHLDKDPEVRKNYVDECLNKIGNLTLLERPINDEAKNSLFDKKSVEHYSTSKIKLNSDLREIKKWDRETILKRQQKLAENAVKIWKI